MRLVAFRIRAFKSIVDTGWCKLSDSDNILVLAGQNEAGKSAIIEALALFENGMPPNFDRMFRHLDDTPIVECTFRMDDRDVSSMVQESGFKELGSFLQHNCEYTVIANENVEQKKIEWSLNDSYVNQLKTWLEKEKSSIEIWLATQAGQDFVYGTPEEAESVDEEPTKAEASPAHTEEAIPDGIDNSDESLQVNYSTAVIEVQDAIEVLLTNSYGEFIVYNSFNDLLPGEVNVSEIGVHPAVRDFETVFNVNLGGLSKRDPRARERELQRIVESSSDDLNMYWTQKLDEHSRYNIRVDFSEIGPSISDPKVTFMIDRGDRNPLFMEQKSKGFRWFSAFNLRLRAHQVRREELSRHIIVIDEPGQGLHEKAQADVKHVLEELANQGAQIIYSTHCPQLIDVSGTGLCKIRLVTNRLGEGTRVWTLAQFTSTEQGAARETLSPIVHAMGLVDISALVPATDSWVVVEGMSDHFYWTAFMKLLRRTDGIFFVPALGNGNIPGLASMLIGWGKQFKVLFDDDGESSSRKIHNALRKNLFMENVEEADRCIKKLKECHGIEDIFERDDFLRYVLQSPNVAEVPNDRNSDLAGERKDILSRQFLALVERGEIEFSAFSTMTQERITKWFDWIIG